MQLEVGSIQEGRISGITKFGAFVALAGGGSGLIHISEIADAYVNDVHDYLSEGQTVRVKVLSVSETGKISLSLKQVQPASLSAQGSGPARQQPSRAAAPRPERRPAFQGEVRGPTNDASFEDKLKQFMQESDRKMSSNRLYADRKNGSRRRR